MKEIVFLVEELSMKEFLKAILPKVIPDNVSYTIIHHEGKQDLEKSIPLLALIMPLLLVLLFCPRIRNTIKVR
jgi:hypothetical protein